MRQNDKTKQVCFLALEYVPDSLEQAIMSGKEALTELQCWQYFKQLMQAVKDIHGSEQLYRDTGFIGRAHRDLKPQNILITADHVLKVIDFGCASPVIDEDSGEPITCKGYRGSINYVAPEVLQYETDKLDYPGEKVDLFACGVILYNMRTAKRPFMRAETSDPNYSLIFRGNWD